MEWLATLLATFVLCASLVEAELPYVKCQRTYRKIGCFNQNLSPAQQTLINDRDPKSEFFQGHVLSWLEFEESIHRLDNAKNLYVSLNNSKHTTLFQCCWRPRKVLSTSKRRRVLTGLTFFYDKLCPFWTFLICSILNSLFLTTFFFYPSLLAMCYWGGLHQ